jgi:hypothetical protein
LRDWFWQNPYRERPALQFALLEGGCLQ